MDKSTFEIKRCTRKEYKEFLRMLNIAFGKGEGSEWFEKNIGGCTPYEHLADDKLISQNFIAVADGRIIGSVGAYPVQWLVTDEEGHRKTVLQTTGVGQVACLPEYRGGGVMSSILNTSITAMKAQGDVFGWLQGDRFRYSNYGYDFAAGNTLVYCLSKKRLKQFINKNDVMETKSGEADIELLNSLYENYSSYILRDKAHWKRQLNRENIVWRIGESNEKKAYICFDSKKADTIFEAQGDGEVVRQMIYNHMADWELSEVYVYSPFSYRTDADSQTYLFEAASHYHVKPITRGSVLDGEKLFDQLKPFAIDQGYTHQLEGLTADVKIEICKRLLSFTYGPTPDTAKEFKNLRPLVFWLPWASDL